MSKQNSAEYKQQHVPLLYEHQQQGGTPGGPAYDMFWIFFSCFSFLELIFATRRIYPPQGQPPQMGVPPGAPQVPYGQPLPADVAVPLMVPPRLFMSRFEPRAVQMVGAGLGLACFYTFYLMPLAPLGLAICFAKKSVRVRLVAKPDGSGHHLELAWIRVRVSKATLRYVELDEVADVEIEPTSCGLYSLFLILKTGERIRLGTGGTNQRMTAMRKQTELMEQIRWLRGETTIAPASVRR